MANNTNLTQITQNDIIDFADKRRIRRIHVMAWRDLDDDEAGGSEIHAHNIERRWQEAGIAVHHRTSFASNRPKQHVRSGYDVTRIGGRYVSFPRTIAAETLKRHGQRDAIIEIWNGVPYFSPLWSRGPHVVWLHHLHGPMWNMALPKAIAPLGVKLENTIAPPFYRKSPVVTLSPTSKTELVDELKFHPDNISVIEPGISSRFSRGGTRNDVPLVVAVGRLVPVKDFPRLVAIIAEVHTHVPNVQLQIVGEGYERERIESEIDRLNARSYITLVGKINDNELVELYRSAWAIASVSSREGWGMTITEAAACGTPAVATDNSGHRDAIVDNKSGLIGTTNDELVDALTLILTNSKRRNELSQGAVTRAEVLTWDQSAYRNLEVVDRAINSYRNTNKTVDITTT